MKFFSPIIIFLIGILSSCLYSPSETNWNEIEPTDSVFFSLNLNDFTDTIPITINTSLSYEFSVDSYPIYLIEFYVDNNLYTDRDVNPGFINLDEGNITSGFHDLRCVIYTKSNTNSLADKLGKEVLIAEFEYLLHVDFDAPDDVEVASFENIEGLLKISWERYDRINFRQFVLYKKLDQSDIVIFSTQDPMTSHCYDSAYIGGKADYYIKIISTNYKMSNGPVSSVERSIPEIKSIELIEDAIPNDKGFYKIEWNRCEFSQAFQSYSLTSSNCFGLKYFLIQNVDSTYVVIEDSGLVGKVTFSLETNSKESQFFSAHVFSYVDFLIGEKVQRFSHMEYDSKNKIIYQVDGDSISSHYLSLKAYIDTNLIAQKDIYLNTGLMTTDEYVVVATPTNILYMEPTSLETIFEYDLSAYGISCSYVHKMQGNSERIHLIGSGNYSYKTDDYYILDLSNSNIIEHYDNTDTINRIDLSRDGKYLLINNSLYMLKDNVITFHKNLGLDYSDWNIEFTNTNNLVLFNSGKLKYLRCDDLSVIYEYQFSQPISTYGRFVDKNRFLFYTGCELNVINLDLQQIIYAGPVNTLYEFSEYFLTDKYIYCNDGFRFQYAP